MMDGAMAGSQTVGIYVRTDGLVFVDGVAVFRRQINTDGTIALEFCDDNRLRSKCRGTRLISVSLDVLVAFLAKV